MSIFASDLRDVGIGIASRGRAFAAALRRTTAAVLLLRLLVFGALLAATALAVPAEFIFTRPFLLAVLAAGAPALFPRTRMVGFCLIGITVLWVLATNLFDDGAPAAWRVLGMAAALYVAHTAAAFAAVVPHDCAIAPAALRRWAMRTALILLVSLGLSAAGMALFGRLAPVSSMTGPILGSLVAAGLAGILAWLVRRRA
jgi:hypothetical protein